MRIFDYLFYKIYRAVMLGSLKDVPGWATVIYFSGLIFSNIFVLGGFLKKANILPFFFSSRIQIIASIVILFVINYFAFLWNERYQAIIDRYQDEPKSQKLWGRFWVWLYVIVSFLSIFAVAFYKPGVV